MTCQIQQKKNKKTDEYNPTDLSLTQKFEDGSTSENQLMHCITSISKKRNRCR